MARLSLICLLPSNDKYMIIMKLIVDNTSFKKFFLSKFPNSDDNGHIHVYIYTRKIISYHCLCDSIWNSKNM